MLRQRFPRAHQFIAARFSPNEELGLHLTAGVLLMALSVWIFGEIADEAFDNGALTALDYQLARYFHTFKDTVWTGPLLVVTHAHAPGFILAATAVLGIVLYRRRERYWLLAMAAAVAGGVILNVLLKYIYQRARPSFDNPVLTALTEYSFPSGHTMGATLFYGFIAAYVACQLRSPIGRVAVFVAAACMALLVAFSRVYLGAHYLSDVMAAMAEGVAWLSICITASSTLRRRKERRGLDKFDSDTTP